MQWFKYSQKLNRKHSDIYSVIYALHYVKPVLNYRK